jgi:hypothetical protein
LNIITPRTAITVTGTTVVLLLLATEELDAILELLIAVELEEATEYSKRYWMSYSLPCWTGC